MKTSLSYLTLALSIAFAAAPFVTSPFSGFRADQLPVPQIDPPVQPEGYAFAIWGLIYAWLVISAVFGALRRPGDADWNAARAPLIVSLAVGVPWLAIANASAIWATVTILIMAAGAIWALLNAPVRDRWLFRAPVALYAGWLTAASAVSIATTAAGFGVLDALTWAYLGITLALCTALVVAARRPDAIAYLAAVIWALVGIILANGQTEIGVTVLAATGVTVLSIMALRNVRMAHP
ncbi:MAG: hypothetical protein AAFN59_02190 [Pseudomonadota bacterium]